MHRILFTIPLGQNGLPIFSYGFMMMLGFAVGIYLTYRRAIARGIDGQKILDLGLYVVLAGVFGARLQFVITDILLAGHADTTPFWQYFAVWEGGLTYQGGLVLATLVAILFMRHHKLAIGTTLDAFAPGLAFGTAFGRIGCYLNGCCFGRITDPDFSLAVRFPFDQSGFNASYHYRALLEHHPEAFRAEALRAGLDPEVIIESMAQGIPVSVHPTQLYSAAGLIALGGLLLVLDRVLPRLFGGMLFLIFLTLYSIMRVAVEVLRVDTPPYEMPLGLPAMRMGQIVSVLTIGLAVGFFLHLWRKRSGTPPEQTTEGTD